jgi:hypothetical protein
MVLDVDIDIEAEYQTIMDCEKFSVHQLPRAIHCIFLMSFGELAIFETNKTSNKAIFLRLNYDWNMIPSLLTTMMMMMPQLFITKSDKQQFQQV